MKINGFLQSALSLLTSIILHIRSAPDKNSEQTEQSVCSSVPYKLSAHTSFLHCLYELCSYFS